MSSWNNSFHIILIELLLPGNQKYLNFPKFSDRQVWANSADPDQTAPKGSLIRVYTVCNSLCIFWMHYSKETPSCSTFRVITTNFWGVQIFRKFTVTCTSYTPDWLNQCNLQCHFLLLLLAWQLRTFKLFLLQVFLETFTNISFSFHMHSEIKYGYLFFHLHVVFFSILVKCSFLCKYYNNTHTTQRIAVWIFSRVTQDQPILA